MKTIANERATLVATPMGAWTPEQPTDSTTQKTPIEKLKVGGERVISSINFTPKICTIVGATFVAGTGYIKGQPGVVSSNKVYPLTNADVGNCSGVFALPNVVTIPCHCRLTIGAAGQTRVSIK